MMIRRLDLPSWGQLSFSTADEVVRGYGGSHCVRKEPREHREKIMSLLRTVRRPRWAIIVVYVVSPCNY